MFKISTHFARFAAENREIATDAAADNVEFFPAENMVEQILHFERREIQ